MSQMSPADLAIVKALPGNKECCDCGQKNPQWASVSFGNIFCLECSGIHRSLGVHISFVRSIAMDSWTEKQLSLMKNGGNKKCNDYLKLKGIDSRTPVKAKYESDHAQLFKEILKARVEGRPEPTSLPPPRKRVAAPASAPPNMGGGGGGMMGSKDPNGMERMAGETDQQYISRQTRLKEEARARMQAKFGNKGGKMGGVGSNPMQGVGSNPKYNPNSGGYGSGIGAPDMDNVINSVSGVFSSGLSMVSSAASAVTDESTKSTVSNLGSTVSSYGGSFWNSLKTTAGDVATAVAQPDSQDDGLAALQRDMRSQIHVKSKYDGFGSSNASNNNKTSPSIFGGMSNVGGMSNMGRMSQQPMRGGATTPSVGMASMGASGLQEAPGLAGEDRNGMESLTGETDEQYIMRQTRLRDEAKARMAAKFGSGGLSSTGPSTSSYTPTPARPPSAPSSGNAFGSTMNTPSSFPNSMSLSSNKPMTTPKAPSSVGSGLSIPANNAFNRTGTKTPPRKNSKDKDDFFADF